MRKEAFINKAFAGLSAIDGAKNMSREYNKIGNKYDDLMATSIVKPAKANRLMGATNAIMSNPIYQNASEEMNILYKEAKMFNLGKKFGTKIKSYNEKTNKLFETAKELKKAGNRKGAFKEQAKGYSRLTPGLVAAGATGYGAKKTIDKTDEYFNDNKDEFNGPSTFAGAALAAGLGAKILTSKNPVGAFIDAKDLAGKGIIKAPINNMKRKSKMGKDIVETIKKTNNSVIKGDNLIKRTAANNQRNKDRVVNNFLSHLDRNKQKFTEMSTDEVNSSVEDFITTLKNKYMNSNSADLAGKEKAVEGWAKQESEMRELLKDISNKKANNIEEKLEKLASISYAKKVFKEHFLKKGLESIPWFAAPATVGYVMNKNIQRGGASQKDDENTKEINVKIASIDNLYTPKVKNITRSAIEKGAEGLGRTLFPAAITAATGRNIMNSFNKIDSDKPFNTQEGIASKIVINLDGKVPKSKKDKQQMQKKIKRSLNQQVNEIIKNASAFDTSIDIGDINDNINKDLNKITTRKKAKIAKINSIVSGVKKKQRMRG